MRLLLLTATLLLPLSINAGVIINDVNYEFNNNSKEATVVAGGDYYGDVVIPEFVTYDGITYSVTTIAGNARNWEGYYSYSAFNGCNNMTSITIPRSIKEIGNQAFAGCSSLKSVYISDLSAWCNIKFILSCFKDNIYEETNPLYYAHDLYLTGNKITELVIPDDITTINSAAFNGGSFSSVKIHKNVSKVGNCAFYDCNSLNDVFVLGTPFSYFSSFYNDNTPVFISSCFSDVGNKTLHIRERYKDKFLWAETQFGKVEFIEGIDYHLIYMVDNEVYKDVFYEVGEIITPEVAPQKNGYSFSGWSEMPETMPDHDVTVTGSFTINKYNLIYMVDGKEYKSYSVAYNSTIIPEEQPTLKGNTFSGWSEIPETMPAHDVTVTGTFSLSKLTKDKVIYEVVDTLNNYCKVIGNDNASGEIKIDSVEIDGYYYKPTEIKDKAFYGCKNITNIEIPRTVVAIGERAFANIDKLTDITIWAEEVPTTDRTAFENSYIDYVTLHVPANSIDKYKSTAPWSGFKEIVAIEGTEPQEKCATPTIDYKDGKLVFECETDGAECITTITSADVDTHYGNVVEISYTYNISTYAKAEGYANSDLVTAMLVWIEQDETTSVLNEEIEAKAVLVQAHDGTIWISGAELGTVIEVYNVAGAKIASINAQQGTTQITTTLNAGDIAIVKIGNRTVKVLMR